MKRLAAVLSLGVLLLWSGAVRADIYNHVEINVLALAEHDVVLDFALYNNNTSDASSVLIDNVRLDGVLLDFESSNALDNWYSYINGPLDSGVTREWGTLNGEGERLMKINGDTGNLFWPVLADRTFHPTGDSSLSFDIWTNMSPIDTGAGLDEFVVTVYDWTGDEQGNFGDIEAFVASADGIVVSPETTAQVVPAPAAILLGLLGFGASGLGLWRGRPRLL